MGNLGDPITPSIPVVGSAGPQFASDINAILTEVVARLSAKIPLSSINFNANLDLSGSDLLNIGNIVFSNQLSTPSGSPFNRFAVFGGNLFYVNAAGPVQITSGATLNAAALAGITGDYGGANPAQLNYVAIDTRYNHYANFGTGQWAYDRALGFDVAGGATSTAFARILWGGISNITMTLPATLPAGNSIMTLDNTGAITAGSTTTLAANNNIVLSGTGSITLGRTGTYKHGVKTLSRIPHIGDVTSVSGGGIVNSTGTGATTFPGIKLDVFTSALFRLPEIPTHARLVNVTLTFDSAANRNSCTGQVKKTGTGDPAVFTTSNVGGAMTNTGTARLISTGLNVQPATGEQFYVFVTTGAGVQPTLVNMIVDYDIP